MWEHKHFKAAVTLKRLLPIKTSPWDSENKQDPAQDFCLQEHTQNQRNKKETFPFSHLLNDRFPTPQDNWERSNEKKTIGRLARQQNVMGAQDSLPFGFIPTLTML